ncbi:MAG: hypothetical protein ABI193_22535 [Minicystis sp.]
MWIGCGGGGTSDTSTATTSGTGSTTAGTGGATAGAGGATAGTGGTGGTGGTSGTGGSTTSAGGAGGGTSGPEAPIMKSVAPLSGALHVTWTNVTPDCDKIDLYRKHDAGDYAIAYTLSGAANSKHDTGAKPPGMYCYKARCDKGGQMSPDSNEKCGTP